VHRAIKWLGEHRSAKGYRYGIEEMERLGEHCSATERRADEATREVVDTLKCIYLKDHLGETYDAVIASVVAFGLFVRLPGIQADGLVHVTALPRDYYHRDPGGTALRGERAGNEYRLTETMKVRLVAVNVEERKIDLVPAETEQTPAKGAQPEGGRKARNRNRSRGR
jgi:ribonuclease R